MVPVYKSLKATSTLDVRLAVTARHRGMLDQVLRLFAIKPDYDLNVMKPGQGLTEITAAVLAGLKSVLEEFLPDLVVVHGAQRPRFRPLSQPITSRSRSAMSRQGCRPDISIRHGLRR